MRRRLVAKQARAGVLWFLGGLIVLHLGLVAAMEGPRPDLRDPEYGRKLTSLRARLAEHPGARPVVLLLGSSRVGVGVKPDRLSVCRSESGGPLVFNFALCGSGPVLEQLCLHRLLDDGVAPDWLLVEVSPQLLGEAAHGQADQVDPLRLRRQDLELLEHYHSQPRQLRGHWAEAQLLSWFSYRFLLRNQYAPSWLEPGRRLDTNWAGLDDWGWLCVPQYRAGGPGLEWRQRLDHVRRHPAFACPGPFRASAEADRALREMLDVCRQRGIRAALLLMPDALRGAYTPDARAQINEYLCRLARDHGVAVLDTRDWVDETGFHDGVHLTHEVAGAFTRRLGRDLLRPLLEGRLPATERVGPGPVRQGPSPGVPAPGPLTAAPGAG